MTVDEPIARLPLAGGGEWRWDEAALEGVTHPAVGEMEPGLQLTDAQWREAILSGLAVVVYLVAMFYFAHRVAGGVLRILIVPNVAFVWLVVGVAACIQMVHPTIWADLLQDLQRRPAHQIIICGLFNSVAFVAMLYILSIRSRSARVREAARWALGIGRSSVVAEKSRRGTS